MKKILLLTLIVCILPLQYVSASIIDGGNVNGYDTFIDQNTGRVWMDMDSFFDMNTTDMVTAANNAGFTFATQVDVQQLLNSLLLTGGEWASTYKPYMMDAPNRELIWGSYYESRTTVGWAWAFDGDQTWTIKDSSWSSSDMFWSSIPNQGSGNADMNIWAYQTGDSNPVPEPATMLLFGLGLLGLAGVNRKKK